MFFNIYTGDSDSHINVSVYIPVNRTKSNNQEITICGFQVAYNDSLDIIGSIIEKGWVVPRPDDPRYARAEYLIKRILCTPTSKPK